MKRSISGKPLACAIALVFACAAQAANPVIYRGVLTDAGAPANGRYDLQFSIRDDAKGAVFGPFVLTDVQVTDGAFAVNLPVDAELVPQSGRMEIAVRDPKIGGSFELLPDAQPFAIGAATGGVCTGTWDTFGNPGIGVGNFLGTTDNAALEMRVNNVRALRLEPYGSGANVLGGHPTNTLTPGIVAATVFGGAFFSMPGVPNRATGSGATLSGGWGNTAADLSVVSGGADSSASGANAVVGGGGSNMATATYATVGGGVLNTSTGDYATVPGGLSNDAGGDASIAAGANAFVDPAHDNTFVWSDGQVGDFASSGVNQFLVRASGGVGLGTRTPFEQLTVGGNVGLTNNADRRISIAAEPNNNTDGKTLTILAGSTFNTGGLAHAGGSLILQAGQGYNASIPGADGGDVILRTGGNHIDGNDDGGDIVFETGGPNGSFIERARLLETGQLRLAVLGAAGATTLCRNASNEIATCSSSRRYKDDIVDTTLGLDTVAALRAVDFTWKADGSDDVGLVAEEVAEISPRLVTYNADGAIEGVRYDRLAAVLVNAMQEQQAQIAALQKRLAEQERQQDAAIQVLIQRVDALRRDPAPIVAGSGETP